MLQVWRLFSTATFPLGKDSHIFQTIALRALLCQHGLDAKSLTESLLNAPCCTPCMWNPTVHDRLQNTGTSSIRPTIHHPSQPGRKVWWITFEKNEKFVINWMKLSAREKKLILWMLNVNERRLEEETSKSEWMKNQASNVPPHPLKMAAKRASEHVCNT